MRIVAAAIVVLVGACGPAIAGYKVCLNAPAGTYRVFVTGPIQDVTVSPGGNNCTDETTATGILQVSPSDAGLIRCGLTVQAGQSFNITAIVRKSATTYSCVTDQ